MDSPKYRNLFTITCLSMLVGGTSYELEGLRAIKTILGSPKYCDERAAGERERKWKWKTIKETAMGSPKYRLIEELL